MWLKLLLSGLIIAFCTALGYFAAEKWRLRRNFYAQLDAFNEKYLAELKYTRKPLLRFLKENRFSGDFQRLASRFADTRTISVNYSYLTPSERESVTEYLSMLGKWDSHAQSGYFSAQQKELAEKRETSEKEAKARGELYLKLGLLAGLAFVILIV